MGFSLSTIRIVPCRGCSNFFRRGTRETPHKRTWRRIWEEEEQPNIQQLCTGTRLANFLKERKKMAPKISSMDSAVDRSGAEAMFEQVGLGLEQETGAENMSCHCMIFEGWRASKHDQSL
jgi:hypothetical protein